MGGGKGGGIRTRQPAIMETNKIAEISREIVLQKVAEFLAIDYKQFDKYENTHANVSIGGNKQSVPELNVPFIGLLTSPQSVETLQFIFELFSIILFLVILFLVVHFNKEKVNDQVQVLEDYWKGSLVHVLLSLIIILL